MPKTVIRACLPRLACAAAAMLALAPPAMAQAPASPAAPVTIVQQDGGSLRPELATPLGDAQKLLGEGKLQEAMAKVEEAARLPLTRTPYETYVLERTRALAAQRLNDTPLVIRALEAALSTGQTPSMEEPGLIEALISLSWNAKMYDQVLRWSQRYIDIGGANTGVPTLRIQAQLLTNDFAGAKAALLARQRAAEQGGQVLPETQLRWLAEASRQTQDTAQRTATMERLAQAYPRPEYWAEVVFAALREPNLSDRALMHLLRLLRATDNLKESDLRADMADLAQRLGQPGEALVLVEEGFANGQLGTGPKAAAHQKLRDQVRRLAAADRNDRPAAEAAAQRAKDGNALVDLGWAIVAGQPAGAAAPAVEPGLALIEQGLARGGLRRPGEARLNLAQAQLAAGRKDAARQTLQALNSAPVGDGLASAARLWSLWAQAPAMLPPRN